MSVLLAGALISGALGLGKAVTGGIQAAKGNKQLKNLLANRPTYTIPEAYGRALSVYSNLASSQMPGQQYYEDKIGESTARAVSAAEKGAISSNVFQGAVANAHDKEIQAIQGLAKMGAEYRTTQMQNYGQALNQYGQLQEKQWEVNQFQPWEIKANMANEKKMAGQQNLFQGLGEMGSAAMNFMGTRYYTEAMKAMQGGGGGMGTVNPAQQFPQPMNNLNATAGNLLRSIPVGMTPYEERQAQIRAMGYNPNL